MHRREFFRAAGYPLAALPLLAHTQADAALPRIGYLTAGANPREPAFWQGMRDLGYVDGRTIVVERRSAEGDFTRLPILAAELVKNRPSVIVAVTSASAIAAQKATSTIPIVMVGASDPLGSGLVGDLNRPGKNVTGTSSQSNAAVGKLLELVRQILPRSERVAVLWDPVNVISQQMRLGETLIAAARQRLFVKIVEAQARADLDNAFVAFNGMQIDAVLTSSDTFFVANARHIAELAISKRVAVLSTSRAMAEAGFLATYGADPAEYSRRSALYVQKILNGGKPGDMPVELPTKFELLLNLRTAKTLGLRLPTSLLQRADELIE